MTQIKTFQINESPDDIRRMVEGGDSPDRVFDPIEAIASDLVVRANEGSLSVYVVAVDNDRDLRNAFALLLAKAISRSIPETLLVDCDFLLPGLSGAVPQPDGLGFLDCLLYGSSLDVIRQTTQQGVTVVGAGSFPVSRNRPFAMEVFDSTKRYLANHSTCVIYCGPALDDSQNVHPLVEHVDLPIVVRVGARKRPSALDPLEERLDSVNPNVMWSVRFVAPQPKGAIADDIATDKVDLESTVELVSLQGQPQSRDKLPSAAAKAPGDQSLSPREQDSVDAATETRQSSALPKILTGALAAVFFGFLFWWVYQQQAVTRDLDEPNLVDQRRAAAERQEQLTMAVEQLENPAAEIDTATQVAVVDTTAPLITDKTASPPANIEPTKETTTTEAQPSPVPDRARVAAPTIPAAGVDIAPPTSASDDRSADIVVTEGLGQFLGQYVLHISSYRRLDNARKDAYYLSDLGYPIVIASTNLGEKGTWYRVYVGPFQALSDARNRQKKLDETPRVKFTRISKVRG